MKLEEITAEAVAGMLDKHNPNWMVQMASQQTLQYAMSLPAEKAHNFLRSTLMGQLSSIAHAIYCLTQEETP